MKGEQGFMEYSYVDLAFDRSSVRIHLYKRRSFVAKIEPQINCRHRHQLSPHPGDPNQEERR